MVGKEGGRRMGRNLPGGEGPHLPIAMPLVLLSLSPCCATRARFCGCILIAHSLLWLAAVARMRPRASSAVPRDVNNVIPPRRSIFMMVYFMPAQQPPCVYTAGVLPAARRWHRHRAPFSFAAPAAAHAFVLWRSRTMPRHSAFR